MYDGILNLLLYYEDLFVGTLCTFHTKPVHLKVKEDTVPKHHETFPIVEKHKETLKNGLKWLYKLGTVRKSSDSTWAVPTFIIPKKNCTVWIISDLRNWKKSLVRKPHHIYKIADVLQKIYGLVWARSLNLNLGYQYIVCLESDSQKDVPS